MKEFLKERYRQIELLKEYKTLEDEEKKKDLLKDYPKLYNGIQKGLINVDNMIEHLEKYLKNYENASGEHKVRQIVADGRFSIDLFTERKFFEKRGVAPPTTSVVNQNIAKLINDYKLEQAGVLKRSMAPVPKQNEKK